jgi:DNA-binding MarR family transcriptional regulator
MAQASRAIPRAAPLSTDEVAAQMLTLMLELGERLSLRDPMGDFPECALTSAQRHTIMWVGVRHDLTMSRLAAHLHTSTATCTGVVDRLERDGYVERVRSNTDRRVVMLRLTDRGRDTFALIQHHGRSRMAMVLSLMDAEDRMAILGIMERAVHAARSRPLDQGSHPAVTN